MTVWLISSTSGNWRTVIKAPSQTPNTVDETMSEKVQCTCWMQLVQGQEQYLPRPLWPQSHFSYVGRRLSLGHYCNFSKPRASSLGVTGNHIYPAKIYSLHSSSKTVNGANTLHLPSYCCSHSYFETVTISFTQRLRHIFNNNQQLRC
jgi:hypothetical protein